MNETSSRKWYPFKITWPLFVKSEQFAVGKNIHHMSTSQGRPDENLWFELEGSVGILVNLKKKWKKEKEGYMFWCSYGVTRVYIILQVLLINDEWVK